MSREITRIVTRFGEYDPVVRESEIREWLRDLEEDPESTEERNGAERNELVNEFTEIRRTTRAAAIERGMKAMGNEANLERPGGAIGAPALVRGLGDGRRESAAVPGRRRRPAGLAGQRDDHQRPTSDPVVYRVGHVTGERQPARLHPEVLSIDIYEDSAMDASNVTSGHKNLAILDMNSFVITNRQPELLLYEPLSKTRRPAGHRARLAGLAEAGPGRI